MANSTNKLPKIELSLEKQAPLGNSENIEIKISNMIGKVFDIPSVDNNETTDEEKCGEVLNAPSNIPQSYKDPSL